MIRQTIVAALVLGGGSVWASDVDISYSQVWPGLSRDRGYSAFVVKVENKGKDAIGVLEVAGGGSSYVVPVELPKGAVKEVPVYFSFVRWSPQSPRVTLKTPSGTFSSTIEPKGTVSDSQLGVGVISSVDGLLAGLRKNDQFGGFLDSTCKPEVAPMRSIGYDVVDVVVLGEGAERLPDESIRAIQRWVLKGGALVFSGGAGAPWTTDDRWGRFIPVKAGPMTNAASFSQLGAKYSGQVNGGGAVINGAPDRGSRVDVSQGGVPLVVSKQVGLGRTVFLAFDLFGERLRSWAGRRNMLKTVAGSWADRAIYWRSLSNETGQTFSRFGMQAGDEREDPFQIRPPSAGTIALILLSFLIVAVPFNFFVLKRLRRGELAWVTLPALSLLFSALIFTSARGLYSASRARSVTGAFIVHEGVPQGVFVGSQQLFFPNAGAYDLGFHDLEAASSPGDMDQFFSRGPLSTEAPELFDLGQFVAPRVEVSNLSFREYNLHQVLPVDWTIDFVPGANRRSDGAPDGKVVNRSQFSLTEARVIFNGEAAPVPDLEPGASASVKWPKAGQKTSSWSDRDMPQVGGALAIEAYARGVPVGSSVGTLVPKRERVKLLYTWEFDKK